MFFLTLTCFPTPPYVIKLCLHNYKQNIKLVILEFLSSKFIFITQAEQNEMIGEVLQQSLLVQLCIH